MPNIQFRPLIAFSLTVVAAASVAHAQQTPVPAPATQQREHTVKPGDTLWDLAKLYLNDPWSWRLIFEANRAVVENPHWIYPAEKLIIPGILPPAEPIGQPVPVAPAAADPAPMPVTEQPRPAVEAPVNIDLRRTVIPVAEYISAPWIQVAPEAQVVGRVIRLADPAADNDKLAATLHPNTRVHLGSLNGARQVGDSLLIVRFTRRIGDWGNMVEPLGVLRVDSVTPTVVTAKVVRQFGAARVGDQVMVLPPMAEIGLGRPSPVSNGVNGELLEFVNQEPLHSTTDVAFISLGRVSGVSIGDEFEVFVPQRRIDDERAEMLPAEAIAVVRVVKVAERTATVRVVNVNSAALRDGLPVRLVRKMN